MHIEWGFVCAISTVNRFVLTGMQFSDFFLFEKIELQKVKKKTFKRKRLEDQMAVVKLVAR